MKKEYNKLVRDKIPEIIQADNKTCTFRVMDEKEYMDSLKAKLKEEVNEYIESSDVSELADLEEVIRALLNLQGMNYDDFEKIRISKADKRGGFEKRILLETVDDQTGSK